ncbi:MAG: hypothetical protein Q8P59_05350 [Dehalococcoidia bacterium]|nr:hypothetical protein [Dehalococcoidia bacterium]
MTHRVQDWLNAYIDALLGERSASSIAKEAQNNDEARLMQTARRLKYDAGKDGLEPRPEFVARLEKELRRELAGASPKVKRIPIWRLSWARGLAGVAAAAAVVLLLFWSRPGVMLPTAPMAAPAAAPQRQEAAPARSPVPGAAAPALGAPASGAPSRPASPALSELVAEAQTILLGRVVEVSAAPAGDPAGVSPSTYGARVAISVERYLKGALSSKQVVLSASSSLAPGTAFSPEERVLVMARDLNGDGVLEVLPYPQAKYSITPEGQAIAGDTAAKALNAGERLTLDELISRIESLVKSGS